MIKVLAVTSVLMFVSLFTTSKIAAIGLAVWIVNVFWIMYMQLGGNGFTVSKFIEAVDDKFEDARSNKRYGEAGVYGATIPLMAMGLIVVFGTFIAMFFFM